MTRARRSLVDPDTTPYYHCICRCVRRAFLCGEDSFTGKSYEHRKGWVLERLRALQKVFAVELCAYAVMSNHYHLVVRLNRGEADNWTEEEVIGRWTQLYSLPLLVKRYGGGETITRAEKEKAREIVAEWRSRLGDLPWYMRSLNEELARRANEEDGCKGRFWEGRFKSQALLDEAAVLTCMSYVDLNPIRAGMIFTPEESDFTSIQQRIAQLASGKADSEKPKLVRLQRQMTDNHPNAFSFSTADYLELVDWAGRAVRDGKRGAIPTKLPPILSRLHIHPEHYLRYVKQGGRDRHVAVVGHVTRLREAAAQLGRRFLKGVSQSQRLYMPPV